MYHMFIETWKYIVYIESFSTVRWCWYLKSSLRVDLFILHSPQHGCWWPGDARSLSITSHGFDLVQHMSDPELLNIFLGILVWHGTTTLKDYWLMQVEPYCIAKSGIIMVILKCSRELSDTFVTMFQGYSLTLWQLQECDRLVVSKVLRCEPAFCPSF